MREKQFYIEINYMRAICIVLVIVGHVLRQTNVNGFNIVIRNIIYSFHMAAFFWVSGFVSQKILEFKNHNDIICYIKGRALRLMVPYFTMGCIYIPFKLLMNSKLRYPFSVHSIWGVLWGNNPDGALWFLYFLFLFSVFAAVFVRKNNIWVVIIISFVLSILRWQLPLNSDFLKRLLYYPFFYFLGMVTHLNYAKVKNAINRNQWICIVNILVFVFLNYIAIHFSTNMYKTMCAVSGILLLYVSCFWLTEKGLLGVFPSILEKIGNNGMEIYILSEPIKVIQRLVILNHWHMNIWIATILVTTITIVTALIISKYIISRSRIMSILLFGKTSTENNCQL